MKKIFIIAIISIIALATMSFTGGNGVTLRLRPIKGKTYVIFSKTNQTTTMKVQNQTMRNSQNMDIRQSFTAKEVSASQNVFETQVDAIKMVSTTMGMTFTYDSDNPQNTSPMIADQASEFDKIIKKNSTVTYTDLGHNADPENLEMSQLNNVIIELPEKELHVGDKWDYVKTQSVSNYNVSINMTYTITKISKKSVDVSFSGTIDSKDITGTYDGTSTIDLQTGIVMESTVNNNLSMTISEQGLEIPVTVKGTSTVSVSER